MDPNNISSISKSILTLLEEKWRIAAESAKYDELLMSNLKLITMEPPNNSPESPISGEEDSSDTTSKKKEKRAVYIYRYLDKMDEEDVTLDDVFNGLSLSFVQVTERRQL
uniref:Uncharacterized protein n=1 Tax=Meloidogyne floridensis TaxID=298350 RepID=A0A915P903_9BILA